MYWEEDAKTKSQKLAEHFSAELADEAERIARRQNAGGVSAAYVEDAANRIGMRRPGVLGDIFLTLGVALGFAALGVWAIVLTEPVGTHLQLGVVKPATIAVGVAGALLTGIGITLKIKA